jgi:hypothetical protein
MKPTGWLIAFLLAPLAALLVLDQGLSGFGVGYGLADAIAKQKGSGSFTTKYARK